MNISERSSSLKMLVADESDALDADLALLADLN
jgi:hypothetical protein